MLQKALVLRSRAVCSDNDCRKNDPNPTHSDQSRPLLPFARYSSNCLVFRGYRPKSKMQSERLLESASGGKLARKTKTFFPERTVARGDMVEVDECLVAVAGLGAQ